MTTRRGFLTAILAAGVAPAIVRSTSIMPLWMPRDPATWFDADAAFDGEWVWTEAQGAKQRAVQSISRVFIAEVTGLYDVTVADKNTGLAAVRRHSLVTGDQVQPQHPDRESLINVRLVNDDR
jgi:hypothetical protein